jgi:hypothetical protein
MINLLMTVFMTSSLFHSFVLHRMYYRERAKPFQQRNKLYLNVFFKHKTITPKNGSTINTYYAL